MRRLEKWLALLVIWFTMAMPVQAGEPDGLGPFADVDGSIHEDDVTALWAADITAGCDAWLFCPEEPVTRGELAAFLTRAIALAIPAGQSFEDTADSPFSAEIEALAAAGITQGCTPDRFCPDLAVSRAQLASFLVRALDLPEGRPHDFGDVDGNVHEGAIGDLAGSGITYGCEDTRYCPDESVTRQQLAGFLARALDLEPPAEVPEIPTEMIDFVAELGWPTGPGAEGWRTLVEEHFAPGDVDRALRIMACESNGDPDARNRSSGASGLFQHMPRYWTERSAGAGFDGESIFDPVANVAVAAWMVYDYPGGGWQHWVCRG